MIVKNSTSVDNIWQSIHAHYGFQSTGGHFLDLADIKLEQGERPEDFYQCLMAFVEDKLLTASGGIKHHEESPTEMRISLPHWKILLFFFGSQVDTF